MSYRLLEAVRLCLVNDSVVHSAVGDRVFPDNVDLTERLTAGDVVTLSMAEEERDSCGRASGLLQTRIVSRLDAKHVWDARTALLAALTARKITDAARAVTPTPLPVRCALCRLQREDDQLYNETTKQFQVRSYWKVLFLE